MRSVRQVIPDRNLSPSELKIDSLLLHHNPPKSGTVPGDILLGCVELIKSVWIKRMNCLWNLIDYTNFTIYGNTNQ